MDAAGNVYVSDNRGGKVVELPAGATSPKQLVTLPFAGMANPGAVGVNAAGDVYVTDSNNQVLELPPGATSSSQQITLPFASLYSPSGVAVDPAGNAYVADELNSRVVELSAYVATTAAVTSVTPVVPVTGQLFTVSVSVTPATGTLPPGGQVTVTDNGTSSCTTILAPGTGAAAGTGSGTCQLSETTGGPYTPPATPGRARSPPRSAPAASPWMRPRCSLPQSRRPSPPRVSSTPTHSWPAAPPPPPTG